MNDNVTGAPTPRQASELIFVKHGNLLFIQSAVPPVAAPPDVFSILHPQLSFDQREFLYGAAARDPNTGKRRRVEITEKRLYGQDELGRLYTNFGFMRRCHNVLKQDGYIIRYKDWADEVEKTMPHPRPRRYEQHWENVERHFQYRPKQKECLEAIAKSQCGLIHAVTAFGKRIAIVMTSLLYPHARIHIVIRGVPLVNQMVDELTRYIPNIGQVGGGKSYHGERVTVFTRDSLPHSDFDADILLGDEAHELITDDGSRYLAQYQRSRNFALTATPTGRSDGSDPRLEGIFGPAIFHIPYPEAVALGLVVPMRVEWRDVFIQPNPARECEGVVKQRRGVWFNDARNDIIANDIVSVPGKDQQFLALTDTIYHAVELYKRVRGRREREPVLVYDTIDLERFLEYKQLGDLPDDLPQMTPEIKEQYRRRFEAGEIDAIATKTWGVGIDPVYLQYLFVAAPFSSEIKAQQWPGRTCRINEAGKSVGVVRDYRDQFDPGFFRASKERLRIYTQQGWEQVVDTGSGFTPLK